MDDTEPLHVVDGSGAATGRSTARVLTWNINGLRKVATSHGGLKALLDQFNADIGKRHHSKQRDVFVFHWYRSIQQ